MGVLWELISGVAPGRAGASGGSSIGCSRSKVSALNHSNDLNDSVNPGNENFKHHNENQLSHNVNQNQLSHNQNRNPQFPHPTSFVDNSDGPDSEPRSYGHIEKDPVTPPAAESMPDYQVVPYTDGDGGRRCLNRFIEFLVVQYYCDLLLIIYRFPVIQSQYPIIQSQ
jgi:hypothetical protein